MIFVESPLTKKEECIAYYTQLGFDLCDEQGVYLAKEKRFSVILNPKINSQVALHIYESKKTESLISPSGVLVHLFEHESPYSLGGKFSILGNYSGVSLETNSLEDSFTFWRQLGFEGSFTPSPGWIELQKNGQQLSIQKSKLCPHVFHNPSLTFFNGQKNQEIIQKIKLAKLPIDEEVRFSQQEEIAQNIILRDPGGIGFFIFNDG